MRIAIILLNQGRGSGEVARQHVKHLISQGHEVYFMHPDIGNGVEGAISIDIKLHSKVKPVHEYLPSAGKEQKQTASMSYEEAIAYLPDYQKPLEEIAHDVDIFIGHHANLTAIAVHNVARQFNKPYTLFLHGTGIEPRFHGLWDDKVWKLLEQAILDANGIIVTTNYVRDELVKPLVPLEDDHFLILPCGVDLKDFKPGNIGDVHQKYGLPETYVICPGALTLSKGPQNVVEASKHYNDLATTVLIGAGELKEELERRLDGNGLLLGFVSSADKAHLINAATILTAAPEKKEHFGIIYAEALAGGTPVVAYEGGGVGSIVTPDVGVLTDRDPEALGLAIRKLLEDKTAYESFTKNTRGRAAENYDYPVLVSELVNWLKGFIST
jgi:glycosyltransferase involved in cell wall biosynthesis